MGRLSNIFHLGIKELRSFLRDPVMVLLIVWAFSFSVYSVATGESQELRNAPIAFVDEDRSPLSQRLIDAIYGPYFKTPERIAFSEVDPGMDAGRYTFVVDIPPNFEREVLAGSRPQIQVNVDATMMSQAFIGAGYIQAIIDAEIRQFVQGYRPQAVPAIELDTRMRFNPTMTSTWFGGVMELINNITMLSVILTGAALIREREHGTLEHLLVMPLTPAEIMSAKVWANGLIVLLAAALSLWLVIQQLLAMPIAGSVPLFLFGTLLHLFSTTSLGIMLATVARTMPQFGLLMLLVILPLQMLSGGDTPRESMPEAVQAIMSLAPTTHFVSFAQAILYRGAGIDVVWPDFAAISVIGAVFFGIALLRFRNSLAVAASS